MIFRLFVNFLVQKQESAIAVMKELTFQIVLVFRSSSNADQDNIPITKFVMIFLLLVPCLTFLREPARFVQQVITSTTATAHKLYVLKGIIFLEITVNKSPFSVMTMIQFLETALVVNTVVILFEMVSVCRLYLL